VLDARLTTTLLCTELSLRNLKKRKPDGLIHGITTGNEQVWQNLLRKAVTQKGALLPVMMANIVKGDVFAQSSDSAQLHLSEEP
jgi:hypothetical protein